VRGERLFVPVEDRANRAVTDGMRRDLQPRSSANATTAVISSGSQFMWPLQEGLLANGSSIAAPRTALPSPRRERLVHRRAANGSSIAAPASPSSMFAAALSQRTAA